MNNKYSTLKYNSKARWLSYWYQIDETVSRRPGNILIIGKGSGIVEDSIASLAPEMKITTIDIDPALSPDVIGDIRSMPFEKSSFDCLICCQVLEHIPFDQMDTVLSGFSNTVRDFAIISVPHRRKHIKLEIDAPFIGNKTIILKYPFMKRTIRSSQHFWEINRGISYGSFIKVLRKYFVIEKTFLNEVNCTHRFFILKKPEGTR
ncbi:MAG: class I SAM-dependent methyltransferase [Nitrospirota bacterium]|nr:class I SAM-dependent methyltransferase [Nitrospirota bacterium]